MFLGAVARQGVLFLRGTIWNIRGNIMKPNEIKGLGGGLGIMFFCSLKIIISIPTRDPFLHLPKKSNE